MADERGSSHWRANVSERRVGRTGFDGGDPADHYRHVGVLLYAWRRHAGVVVRAVEPPARMTSDSQPFGGRTGRRPMRRLLVMLIAVACLPVAVVALALGWWEVPVVVVVALQAAAVVLLVDARRRMAELLQRNVGQVRQISELLQRRVGDVATSMISAAEASRLETADGITELRNAWEEIGKGQAASADELVQRLVPGQVRQVEALLQLYDRIRPRAAMPSSGGWTLDAAGILALLDVVEQRRPGLVVELGSGASSVWLGYALERLGSGRLVSVEHDTHRAEATRQHVCSHGIDRVVEVRVAPLVEAGLPDHEALWYDASAFDDLSNIDLLIVDGPPNDTGRYSRYPALPKLVSVLSVNGAVALHDDARLDEREILERWRAETPEFRPLSPSLESSLQVLVRDRASN